MEFKFRAGDDQPPEYFPSPPSSSFGYFYDQAMRAGYSSSDPVRNLETIVRREMEKDSIREEVIVEEIARRRLLETEVGREMAMRFAGRGEGEEKTAEEQHPLEERLKIPVALANQFVDCRWLEERLAYCRSRRMMFDHLHRFLLHQEAVVQPSTAPSAKDSKEKLIILASSRSNLSGAKRKAATSPDAGAGDLPFSGLERKHKDEQSCALCHVRVGSERAMNDHVQGRKHKAKEAEGLRAQKMPKNGSTANVEPEAKAEAYESHNSSEKIEKNVQGNTNFGMPVGQTQDGKSLKKNEDEILKKEGITLELKQKRKFEFWCEMCMIGTHSKVVMEAHKNGKRHRVRLEKLGHNGEATKDSKTVAEEEKEGKAKESKTMAEGKEGKVKDLEMAFFETKEDEVRGPEVTIMVETNWGKFKETAGTSEETKE